MKKSLFLLLLALGLLFSACSVEEPSVVCGREWNPGTQVVADTASEFALNDPLIVQFRYGKNFDFTKLTIAFYEGTLAAKGKKIWDREVAVNEKLGSYTLQGKSKSGGLMTVRELARQKHPGTVVVEFSTEGRVLASKELNITKNK